jgi:hypothetical protein
VKRHPFVLTIGFLLAVGQLNAQLILTSQNQNLRAGDEHHFKLAGNIEEGAAGANQVWDFSSLQATGDMTSYMLNAEEVAGYNYIPMSNTVIRENQNNFFFKTSENLIEEYGTNACSSIFVYDKPLVKLRFPFTYKNQSNGAFSGTAINSNTRIHGTYKVEADAYGTLILPGNITIENVLRVRSERNEFIGKSETTTLTYRWYSEDVRYPLVTIIKYRNKGIETPSLTAYYADASSSQKKSSTVTSDNIEDNNISLIIYPNPFKDNISLNYQLKQESTVEISLFDNTGKQVYYVNRNKLKADYYTEEIDTKQVNLSSGMYIVKIVIDKQVYTKKLFKTN